MEGARHSKRSILLLVVCCLLGVTSLLDVFHMFYVINNIQDDSIAFVDVFVIVLTLLDALLRIAVIVQGVMLCTTRRSDTSDAVNRCQSTAIASAGLCVIGWMVDTLADSAINNANLIETAATVCLIIAYYYIVKGMEHTTFWDGIRTTKELEPFLDLGDVATRLVIDQEDSLLRPAKDDEVEDISLVTPMEYVNLAPIRLMQQVHHSLDDVKRSSCVQLGDITIGNLFNSAEVQRAAGFDATEDIGFSYQFSEGRLILVMDEDGPERTFLRNRS